MSKSKLSVEEYQFQEIGPDHYAALASFFEANNIPQVVRKFNPFPLTAVVAERIACLPHKDLYYGVFQDKLMIGFAMLRGWEEGYEIPSLGILVDYHFRGIGTKILDFMVQKAKQLGCPQVSASVYADNPRVVNWLIFKGFREISRHSVEAMGEPNQKIILVRDMK